MPSLIAILGLDAGPFRSGLQQAQIHANRAGRGLAMAIGSRVSAALAGISIGLMVRNTIDWSKALRNTADNLGVNVEWLQKMQNGAKLAGAELSEVEKTILMMNRSRQAAVEQPGGSQARAFGRMGISPSDIKGLSTQGFFDKIIKAFASGATIQLSNDVQTVGGRSARNLIAAFANQFESDMPIMREKVVDALKKISDEFDLLKQRLTVSTGPAVGWVGERVADFADTMKETWSFLEGMGGALLEGDFANAFNKGGAAMMTEFWSQAGMEAALASAAAAAAAARKARENAPPNFSPLPGPKHTLSAPQVNALQKVGAFAQINPERAEMIRLARKIAGGVDKIADNTEPDPVADSETKF